MKSKITFCLVAILASVVLFTRGAETQVASGLVLKTLENPVPPTPTSFILFSEGTDILTIAGIKEVEVTVSNARLVTSARYLSPEKPDEITAILTTKDGKKWRAQWVPKE